MLCENLGLLVEGNRILIILIFFFKTETLLSFVLDGIQTHNLLICQQTLKPSCLGVQQEDSCLTFDLDGLVDSLYRTSCQND